MFEKNDMISKKEVEVKLMEALGLKPSQKFLFYQLRKRSFNLETATRICHETKCGDFHELLKVVE